ncbi:hypothetical protein V8F20_012318 [Naviculisporaceae sp. PSN 640]
MFGQGTRVANDSSRETALFDGRCTFLRICPRNLRVALLPTTPSSPFSSGVWPLLVIMATEDDIDNLEFHAPSDILFDFDSEPSDDQETEAPEAFQVYTFDELMSDDFVWPDAPVIILEGSSSPDYLWADCDQSSTTTSEDSDWLAPPGARTGPAVTSAATPEGLVQKASEDLASEQLAAARGRDLGNGHRRRGSNSPAPFRESRPYSFCPTSQETEAPVDVPRREPRPYSMCPKSKESIVYKGYWKSSMEDAQKKKGERKKKGVGKRGERKKKEQRKKKGDRKTTDEECDNVNETDPVRVAESEEKAKNASTSEEEQKSQGHSSDKTVRFSEDNPTTTSEAQSQEKPKARTSRAADDDAESSARRESGPSKSSSTDPPKPPAPAPPLKPKPEPQPWDLSVEIKITGHKTKGDITKIMGTTNWAEITIKDYPGFIYEFWRVNYPHTGDSRMYMRMSVEIRVKRKVRVGLFRSREMDVIEWVERKQSEMDIYAGAVLKKPLRYTPVDVRMGNSSKWLSNHCSTQRPQRFTLFAKDKNVTSGGRTGWNLVEKAGFEKRVRVARNRHVTRWLAHLENERLLFYSE